MAAKLSSLRKREPDGIMSCLSSAACEWFLMFLLFVDALFSYLLREFANYCELQTPCHLCSMLDHVFGGKKLGCSSWSSMCSSHKKEISSLVFCSIHNELADFRVMCEECLKSIAMQKNSECEFGKLWVDSGSRTCSCCNKTWLAAMSDDESLIELKPVGLGGYEANVEPPMLHVPSHSRFSRGNTMKRLRDKLAASVRHRTTRKSSVGTLSHAGYTKLELLSDSEPEKPLPGYGGGDGNTDSHTRLDRGVECGIKDHPGMPVSNVISEKQTHQGSEGKDRPSLLDLNEVKTADPSLSRDHCLVESQPKGSLGWTKDVTPLDCVARSPDVGSSGDSSESSSVSSDSVFIFPSASSTVRITKKSIYIEETCERVNISESMKVEEATDGTSSDDSTCSSHSYNRTLTGTLCHCCEEDTKCIRASNSEVGLSLEDEENEESGKDEDCSSLSLQLPLPPKRNESSYEWLDGFRVKDAAGESRVDVRSLYEELEEERKAADIAVDEAMAMITRLQEEKAGVVMAAAQYIQLMELQAEFDMESLERDLLSKKEKELQDLQNELEWYRNSFWDGSRKETSNDGDSGCAKHWRCDPMSSCSVSESWDEHTLNLNKLVKNLYKDYCSENVEGMTELEQDGGCVSYESELDERLKETD